MTSIPEIWSSLCNSTGKAFYRGKKSWGYDALFLSECITCDKSGVDPGCCKGGVTHARWSYIIQFIIMISINLYIIILLLNKLSNQLYYSDDTDVKLTVIDLSWRVAEDSRSSFLQNPSTQVIDCFPYISHTHSHILIINTHMNMLISLKWTQT